MVIHRVRYCWQRWICGGKQLVINILQLVNKLKIEKRITAVHPHTIHLLR